MGRPVKKLGKALDSFLGKALSIDFTVDGKTVTRNIGRELDFDADNLNKYMHTQPALFALYNTLLTMTKKQVRSYTHKLAMYADEINSLGIKTFKRQKGKIPNKSELHGYLMNRDKRYRKLIKKLDELELKADALEGIVKAFDQRGKLMKDAFYIGRGE